MNVAYQFVPRAAARLDKLEASEIGPHVRGFHLLQGAYAPFGADPYGLGFVVEEWHCKPDGTPGPWFYVLFEREEFLTQDWGAALDFAEKSMQLLGYEAPGLWRDFAAQNSTDALADMLAEYQREQSLEPLCALETLMTNDSLTQEQSAWLQSFCQRWDYVQDNEDLAALCRARGIEP